MEILKKHLLAFRNLRQDLSFAIAHRGGQRCGCGGVAMASSNIPEWPIPLWRFLDQLKVDSHGKSLPGKESPAW